MRAVPGWDTGRGLAEAARPRAASEGHHQPLTRAAGEPAGEHGHRRPWPPQPRRPPGSGQGPVRSPIGSDHPVPIAEPGDGAVPGAVADPSPSPRIGPTAASIGGSEPPVLRRRSTTHPQVRAVAASRIAWWAGSTYRLALGPNALMTPNSSSWLTLDETRRAVGGRTAGSSAVSTVTWSCLELPPRARRNASSIRVGPLPSEG
jgi:hypothetical protein